MIFPFGVRYLVARESGREIVAVAAVDIVDDLSYPVLGDPVLHGHLGLARGIHGKTPLDKRVERLAVPLRPEAEAAHLEYDVAFQDHVAADLGRHAVYFGGGKRREGDRGGGRGECCMFHIVQRRAAMAAPTMGASSTCGVIS